MKWISMIVVLIVGVFLVYQLFMKKAPEGSPRGVAEKFHAAAVENDSQTIRSLCLDSAAASALEAAKAIFATKPEQNTFNRYLAKPKWVESETKADFALTSAFSGKIMTIEFKRVGNDWKISAVGY